MNEPQPNQTVTERVDRELVIPAPPEEVWSVITADGWLADEVHMDLVPGGEARFLAGDQIRTGWVEEAREPSDGHSGRLVVWWAVEGEPVSRVDLSLDPEERGCTRVRICETRPLEVLDLVGIPLPGSGGASPGPAMLVAA